VTRPVIVADCNGVHPGVCIVGEAEATVLPWIKNATSSADGDRKTHMRNLSKGSCSKKLKQKND